jgi:hypothetical protein
MENKKSSKFLVNSSLQARLERLAYQQAAAGRVPAGSSKTKYAEEGGKWKIESLSSLILTRPNYSLYCTCDTLIFFIIIHDKVQSYHTY